MSLVVEDGTGKSDAESYIAVADISTYITARYGASHAFVVADTPTQEMYARRATSALDAMYGGRLKGVKVKATQALLWPRAGTAYYPSPGYGLGYGDLIDEDGYVVASNSVPTRVQQAESELARRIAEGIDIMPDISTGGGGRVIHERVDVIEVTYADDRGASLRPTFDQIDSLMWSFLRSGSSGIMIEVQRA